MAVFSRIKTWVSGEILTAADLNAEFDNILTNMAPAGIEDASANVGAMQATTSPGGVGTESLATNLLGEIQRIRFKIKQIIGQAQWYSTPVGSLSTNGILTASINDLAVTTAKIDALAVTAAKIASNAVTTAKILDANVTVAKLSSLNSNANAIVGVSVTPAVGTSAWSDLSVDIGVALSGLRPAQIIFRSTDTNAITGTLSGDGGGISVQFRVLKDSTTSLGIYTFSARNVSVTGTFYSIAYASFPSLIWLDDTPSAATHNYRLQYRTVSLPFYTTGSFVLSDGAVYASEMV